MMRYAFSLAVATYTKKGTSGCLAVRCYNVITLTGTRMSHCRNIQGKAVIIIQSFPHPASLSFLNLGASALLGYEAVNNGNRLLDDGASLRKYESFIYGAR